MNLNTQKVCRACLQETISFQSIFSINEGSFIINVSFADMIMSISSSVYIELEDGLPDVVCSHCATKIMECYKLKLKIEENNMILRSRLVDLSIIKAEENIAIEDSEILIKQEKLNDFSFENCNINSSEEQDTCRFTPKSNIQDDNGNEDLNSDPLSLNEVLHQNTNSQAKNHRLRKCKTNICDIGDATKRMASTSSVTLTQVNNFVKQLGKKKYGQHAICLDELEAFLVANTAIPDDPNKAFVVEYEICDKNKPEFRFLISSKKMLELASKSKKIHTDSTYKLIWHGFPILFIGTTDMDREYHHFGVGVCTNETSQDFEFLFKSLKSGIKKICDTEIMPEVLISDASKNIHNGFRNVFGSENKLRMCWTHMRKNVSKYVEKLYDKEKRIEILADLDQLQLAKSSEMFDHVVGLFLKKWSKLPKFTKYFEDEWLNKNRNWYEGVLLKTPSTNNSLEATVKVIKYEHIFRERLPLNKFKEIILEMVSSWSMQYELGLKSFHEKPTITLSDWTAAYQWAQKKVPIKQTSISETHDFFLVMADDESDLVEPCPIEDWREFTDFLKNNFKICTISYPKQEQASSWIDGNCDCPKFMKNFMCLHVIGVALLLDFTKAPLEARQYTVLFGQKRKRGRPSVKSKKALLVP